MLRECTKPKHKYVIERIMYENGAFDSAAFIEHSPTEAVGHYTLIEADDKGELLAWFSNEFPAYITNTLTEAEKELLSNSAGVIFYEACDVDECVTATWYDDPQELAKAWRHIKDNSKR